MCKKIFGIATLVLLLLTILSVVVKSTVRTDTTIGNTQTGIAGDIKKDTVIESVFTPKVDIVGLKFLFATYGKKITRGKLIVKIYDDKTNEQLAKTNIEAEHFKDNDFVFAKTGLLDTKGRKIRVTIEGRDFSESKYVTLWIGKNQIDKNLITNIDNKRISDNLIFTTTYLVKDNPYTWELVLLSTICFLMFVMQWDEKVVVEKQVNEQSESKDERIAEGEKKNN